MRLIVIESPYAGDVEANLEYLDRCIRDCLKRDETPYASHKMLTTALDDDDPEQRKLGIAAGLAVAENYNNLWDEVERIYPTPVAFYVDKGWSNGMLAARDHYESVGVQFEVRKLDGQGRANSMECSDCELDEVSVVKRDGKVYVGCDVCEWVTMGANTVKAAIREAVGDGLVDDLGLGTDVLVEKYSEEVGEL